MTLNFKTTIKCTALFLNRKIILKLLSEASQIENYNQKLKLEMSFVLIFGHGINF